MIKYLFITMNLVCLTLCAHLAVNGVLGSLLGVPGDPPQAQGPAFSAPGPAENPRPLALNFDGQYRHVAGRNLFMVKTQSLAPQAPEKKISADHAKPSTLDIKLKGVVMGMSPAWAVIEEGQKKIQTLYKIGDTIQGGQITQILKDRVIFVKNGEAFRLEMDIRTGGLGKSGAESRTPSAGKTALRPEKNQASPPSPKKGIENQLPPDGSSPAKG